MDEQNDAIRADTRDRAARMRGLAEARVALRPTELIPNVRLEIEATNRPQAIRPNNAQALSKPFIAPVQLLQ